MKNKIKTGYLNNYIDIEKCQSFFQYHSGIGKIFEKFKPSTNDKHSFKLYYTKFLTYKRKNESELLKYNFYSETIESHISGTKIQYHTKHDFCVWSELFEYYFIILDK